MNEKDLDEIFLDNEEVEDYFYEIDGSVLNETKVYINNRDKLYIAIHPSEGRNFDKDPYFKVTYDPSMKNNNAIARISMTTGEYVVHNKTTVELPRKVVDRVNDILQSPSTSNKSITVWDAMVEQIPTNMNIEDLKEKLKPIKIDPDISKVKSGTKITRWKG